jgi:hypothetical protein
MKRPAYMATGKVARLSRAEKRRYRELRKLTQQWAKTFETKGVRI